MDRLLVRTDHARRSMGTLWSILWGSALGIVVASSAIAGGGPASFTDEATLRGVNYVTGDDGEFGEGIAFADLDDDGDPDLVLVGRVDGVVGVYENDGTGNFTDHSATSGIPVATRSTGVIAGDYDLDGDLDLYISQGFDTQEFPTDVTPNFLLSNDGGFQFTDVTAESCTADDGPSFGCAWGDYDNDGLLDLYVSNRFTPNKLFHNLGGGVFEDVAVTLGVDRADDPTYQSSFFDFDQDGDADLYVGNDKADCTIYTNHLFENDGGTFTDITVSSGTEGCVWSMCIALGDFDGNGHMDMYVTNLPPGNALMLNQGNDTFTRGETLWGVQSFAIGWGSLFFDYDNDGHLDLYVCNVLANNRLYAHNGSWPCFDWAAMVGVDNAEDTYTVAGADIDDDGDVDIAVQNADQAIRLYINGEGDARRWVKLDVHGEGPARHAIGAVIKVLAGGVWRMREVIAGCNYLSQNELTQHIGIGGAVTVDQIDVLWPGGQTRTLLSLPGNTTWAIYPPDKLGDHDGDDDQDLDDFVALVDCYGAAVTPGCEMMDFDGDGDIGSADYDAFLLVFDGTPEDCNGNTILDMTEIIQGSGADANDDGMLDECQCPADFDGDGSVGVTDLLQLLGEWGPCPGCDSDISGDGVTSTVDLLALLGAWGRCTP